MSEMRYDGKVAVVTGAGQGLGRSHALFLASRGAKVVVNDLGGATDGSGASQTPAQKVCDEISAAGGQAVPNLCYPDDDLALGIRRDRDAWAAGLEVEVAGGRQDEIPHRLRLELVPQILVLRAWRAVASRRGQGRLSRVGPG